MKTDIINRNDIELLVNTFYNKVKVDPVIGYFFTKVVSVDWDKHLPVMYNFWENIIFHSGGYDGNPMVQHQKIHSMSPLSVEHFERWISLFSETVDQLYEGEKAELIKHRARNIATVMQIKILS